MRQSNQQKQIIDGNIAKQMAQMLNHVITRGTGKKAQLPYFAAGKTGTTQNYRDAWFVGWAGGYVAAVWVGNDNEKPMNKVGGGTIPAEIWHDVMLAAHNINPLSDETDSIGALIDYGSASSDSIGDLIEEDLDNESKTSASPSTLENLLDSIF